MQQGNARQKVAFAPELLPAAECAPANSPTCNAQWRLLSPVKYAPFRSARTFLADMRWLGWRLDMPLERDIAIQG